MAHKPSCALILLNFNGRAHLETAVPSALEAARAYGPEARVIVLDNRSTEPDAEFVRTRFPGVDVVTAEKNDLLFSYNALLPRLSEPIAILLNNDMRFEPGFITPLLSHFSDERVFAVTANIKTWDGSAETAGQRYGEFRRGWFYKKWRTGVRRARYTLDACGGAMAVRREAFIALGGFDTLYRPGYCEDLDLSYRAWKAGWKVVYEPAAVVYHRIGASLVPALGGDRKRTRLICRNEMLFIAKNCGNGLFMSLFLLLLPFRALKALAAGYGEFAGAFADALPRLPRALTARAASRGKEPDILTMIGPTPRAVFLTTDSKPALGGIASYLENLREGLAHHGMSAEIFSTVPGAERPLPARPARELGEKPGDKFIITRKWNTRLYYRALERQADADITAVGETAHVVINYWPIVGHFWCRACRKRNIAYTLICHGLELAVPVNGPAGAWRKEDLIRARLVIVNSAATAALADGTAGKKLRTAVVNPGIDTEIFKEPGADKKERLRAMLGIRADAKLVLSLGRLIRRKGFDRVLEAAAALKAKWPALVCLIAGDGPERPALEAQAKALGIADRVRFLPARSDDDKWTAYALSEFFVMPNRTLGGSDWEGFGIVYIEAALAGRPSIGGDNGGVRDAIVDGMTGFVVPSDPAGLLEDKMNELLSDERKRTEMGRAARERALREMDRRTMAARFAVSVFGENAS